MRVSLLPVLVAVLWALCVRAANVDRLKRQTQLRCDEGETKAVTPYLSVPTSTANCAALMTSMVDYYVMAYREACHMWLDGGVPDHVGGVYVSFCQNLKNGTTVYRVEVCCEGERPSVSCFTCSGSPSYFDLITQEHSSYTCNYHGTGIQTCPTGQVCMTTVEYPSTGYGVYTKSCAQQETCASLVAAADCQNGKNPNCVYCCDTSFCNYDVAVRFLQVSNGECPLHACYNSGTCVPDVAMDLGYRCICPTGFSGDKCEITPCSSGPCQNGGMCHVYMTRVPEYFICSCYAAYRGYACEIEADLCAINICQNGGTCYDHLDYGQRCACTADWIGHDCSVPLVTSCPAEEHLFSFNGKYGSITYEDCSDRLAMVEAFTVSYTGVCISQMDSLYRENPKWREGVNGQVSEIHWVSMGFCQKGDHGMIYNTRFCCPACLSNPCQNGGWCQQKTDGEYVCKCRYGYGGDSCEFREAICYATGDPHYRGWDGRRVSFQSPCKYIMAESLSDTSDAPYFKVLVKHEYRNEVTTVSYVKYVELIVNNNVIRIGKGKVVMVNGLISSSGAKYNDFEILDNGRFMRVTTSFGVTLESDGDWTSVVKLPDIYRNQVQGLCGSFDGNQDNDLITSDGVDVQHEENAHTTFGNSWKYEDPDEPTCQNAVSDPLTCTGELLAQVQSNSMCGFITDTSDDNPLSECVGNPEASAQQFFEACVYDVCANQEGNMEEVLCKSIEAFAFACRDLGYTNAWRSQDRCPLDCPANSHYESSTSACQATCANLNAASECPLPDTENCLCDEGYVMQDGRCIPADECGCLDESRVRYEAGHEWLSSDCTKVYLCDEETFEIVSTTQAGCPEGSGCLLQDGSHQCVSLGCNVDGVLVQPGTEWQKNDCTEAYACSDGGVVDVHPLNGCAANEQCTVVGPMQYECKVVSCMDPVTGFFYAIGDTWLNDDCSARYICTEDGHTVISADHNGCSNTQTCQQQSNLYLCVEVTCLDQTGQTRQVGSRWLSPDCSLFSDCTVNGIVETVHSCQAFETCQPGDLGKCVATQSWDSWGLWSECSGGCNSGEQRRFRTCNPPGAQCPGESSESRPCQCDHQFNPEDCDKCKMVSNVLGYLPDTCDCGSFYQCEKQVDGSWKAYHRPCAPCTEWNQDVVTCTRVDDDCQANVVIHDNVINFQDDYCEANGIRYREYAADASKYMKLVFSIWLTLPCPIGTKFSFKACQCINDENFQAGVSIVSPITCLSFDVGFSGSNNIYAEAHEALLRPGLLLQAAYFAGNARVEVPYFNNRINFKEFAVSLWFKRTGFSSTLQGLLTNGDCVAAASIEVLITSASTCDVTLDTDGGKAVVQGITASSDQWYHMVLTYNGERLNVYMDGQLVATNRNAGGRIQQRHCPMLIGTGGNGLEFTGYIDQVCFYAADLDGNKVQELYLAAHGPGPT